MSIQFTRVLMANTRNPLAGSGNGSGGGASASDGASRRLPDIGPMLVVAYTNHALDAYMLGLVNAGVTDGLLRVESGSGCKVPQLQQYCLRKVAQVWGCRANTSQAARAESSVTCLQGQYW